MSGDATRALSGRHARHAEAGLRPVPANLKQCSRHGPSLQYGARGLAALPDAALQALERLFGERLGLPNLGLFVIRPAEADRDECVAFQDIQHAAETIAGPESFVA